VWICISSDVERIGKILDERSEADHLDSLVDGSFPVGMMCIKTPKHFEYR